MAERGREEISSTQSVPSRLDVNSLPADAQREDSAAAQLIRNGLTQQHLPHYVFPSSVRSNGEADDYSVDGGDGGCEGESPRLARSNSVSSTTSWYSPSKRRAGLGTQRRNALLFRSVDFKQFDSPTPNAKRRKSTGGAAATPKVSSDSEDGSGGYGSSSSSSGSDSMDSSSVESISTEDDRSDSRHASSLSRTNLAVASPLDQLFAVVARSTRQLWRRKLDLLLEVVVPLIFIAVSIALWAIWGNEYNKEMQYLNYSEISVTESTIGAAGLTIPVVYDFTCIRQPAGTGVFPYFTTCPNNPNVICDGDPTFLPFPEGTRICRFNYTYISNWETLISASLQFYWRRLTAIPTLDALISFQWTVLTSYKEIIPLISATMGGLAANTRFSSILCSGTLYFVGPSDATAQLITYMDKTSKLFTYVVDRTVYSSVAAARAASRAKENGRLWAIVELRQVDAMGLDLVLHMNNSALPSFGTTYDDAYSGGVLFDTAELYVLSGFSTLQQLVSEFYLNSFHKAGMDNTQMIVAAGTPAFYRRPLLINAREVLPLIYVLAFLYSVSQQVKRTVLEKELRIREAMLIMGLKQWTLYVSDFVVQLFIFVMTCILCTVMLKTTYVTKSDPMVLFLIFFIFALTTIPLSGIIAAFFSKARLASLVAPVIYFILVIPMFAMANAKGSIVTGFSMFSPSGFAAALNVFLVHETGSGCGRREITSSHDDPTMAVILGMLTADFFLYYLLMLYLDAVVPKEWGTPKHPLFFVLDPIDWCFQRKHKRLEGGPDGRAENGVFETTDYADDVVSFDGLRKEYTRGGERFLAVNNLYWGMQEGEISVLLGHNGAGKTTVLNMMTGMTEPDEGDCYIYGHSVRTEKSAVRQLLGFCPQHNILWSELTCRDHLEFYGKIKGLKGWELEDAICGMLFETDLLDKMDQPAGRLSGGMKRKLSIAIAFVGGSRLVFLDEPTAGLDVGARRQVWELLKRMAQSRTLLLTTHYMDEADLLGSRIGIMSQGRLKCTGSSLFLKSRLGVGYNIVISIDPEIDAASVDDAVLGAVAGATVLGHNGCELSYQLPSSSVDQFPALLSEIDSVEAEGIRGYALSATTLEEVFLKVSEEDLDFRGRGTEEGDVELIWSCEVTTSALWSQFRAIMEKRLWNALRDRRMQCFQIVCPVLCILIAMLLSLVQYRTPQTLSLTYDMFRQQPRSVMDTAFCYQMWGTEPYDEGFTVNETYFQTAAMLSEMLLDTWYVHAEPRYGAVSCLDANMTYTLQGQHAWRGNHVNVFLYNSSSYHQVALNFASFYDLFLKHFKGSDAYNMKYTATLFNKPSTTSQLSFVFIGALIMVPFTFLPSNPVAWIVKERQCGARHLQNLCGLNFFVYWGASFLFDMAAYFITMLLCVLIFACFNRQEFTAPDRVGGTFVLFIVYGFTSTAFGYCLSFLFRESTTAQSVVMGVSFVAGFLLLMIVYVLSLDAENVSIANKMRWGFRVIPSYCIGEGIVNLLTLTGKVNIGSATGVWDMDQLGWSLVYMTAEFPALCIITLLVDHPAVGSLCQRLRYRRGAAPIIPSDEDSDVEDEREAVYEAESDVEDATDVVRVVNLQKKYSNGNVAVKGITFSIFPGEVFGLLGTNGAGKTTTISMLCQQFLPTGGSAYVCGYDIVTQRAAALQCIGYCPQFDGTLDLLTVEEQLQMYAGIRGIARWQWGALVDALCTLCELTTYRKTVTGELSGGNRRKLSVAMSLVGGPLVLFLDEPSAGMDPVARRGMWTAIQRAAKHCSVVLTTHHLEEVEALADIVAIMVRGYIRCIGDKVHLKNKFGSAFEVSVRLSSARHADGFVAFMKGEFPDAKMNEGDGRRFVYQLPRDRGFGDIFEVFQTSKKDLHITDYSVSQTSIEQVFLLVREEAMHLTQ
ncbi:ATP-binding cassette protein subfamily A member 3 putative (ABCA3) [Leptomonas pyrrhocoris]|uniref:ATP-binding cassette protein subfamily A member 3 putative (ABCA3) n=1 Tax=Leptomonas pyrrhocoris TaxID=157538 RepID=A0A0M9FVT9_LEPPY|nr:ATP-binding cassette protein subfamily A member 3 putative (ABCA3) [Leptomonas pyrrhocoris]XP_015655545.1 ATP-binding cassette protein subfamily A member 3 putative (ABCA3) [Leptomonas pyrrhocoris]KPA77105.1 ATP-binding cassette protein subfamily A member 3 putative (ABCA3) [Leptomonas pyrrhocoris]KPA77106.1 ATP-binding cassette protein subfamily A member 3 putative (ABCA3) [Leptomonas pyrrhocoris]|eukprot:XP_015655544.1 ATP-binding cassette protein subfamily A member 3 putative (ABCA3) [Leptomonas pyrrhocoris]